MIRNWLMVEHHRMHVVEQWPESAHRSATLAAIRRSIETLTQGDRTLAASAHCAACRNAAAPAGSGTVRTM